MRLKYLTEDGLRGGVLVSWCSSCSLPGSLTSLHWRESNVKLVKCLHVSIVYSFFTLWENISSSHSLYGRTQQIHNTNPAITSIVKLVLLTDGQHKANRWGLSVLACSPDILRGTNSSHNLCREHNLFCISQELQPKTASVIFCISVGPLRTNHRILANTAVGYIINC